MREVFYVGSVIFLFITSRREFRSVVVRTCIFLYSRLVHPWVTNSRRILSWSCRFRWIRFFSSSNSSLDVEKRSFGTTFVTSVGGPNHFTGGLKVIVSSESRVSSPSVVAVLTSSLLESD